MMNSPSLFQTHRSIVLNLKTIITIASCTALLSGCGGDSNSTLQLQPPGLLTQNNQNFNAACTGLKGYQISSADIGLSTNGAVVISADNVASTDAGNVNGDYCMVKGKISPLSANAPDITFQLNIPKLWNNRTLQMGGGGYNGTVVTGLGAITFAPMDTTPLAQGYVTYGSDSGHESAQGGLDASFALNDEALVNYGYAHIKKVHDTAGAILQKFFGSNINYKRYFAGGSTGGREGLTAIQRFPYDYDGAFVGSPTANFAGIRMIGLSIGRLAYGPQASYINTAQQTFIRQQVLNACDSLDGVKDGIVSNISACRNLVPTIRESVRCSVGNVANSNCLSDNQLALADLIHEGLTLPYALSDNIRSYSGYNIWEGADFSNPSLGLGTSNTMLTVPTLNDNGYLFSQGTQWLIYFLARDPNFSPLNFDPMSPGEYSQRIIHLTSIVGATNPDLSPFFSHGGKLILMQGAADTAVSPNSTIDYVNSVVNKVGGSMTNASMRFYVVPGFGHGVGSYIPKWDAMKALDNWVSNNTTPDTLASTDVAASTRGRSRPLCQYPTWPKYLGTGDINSASSFVCAKE